MNTIAGNNFHVLITIGSTIALFLGAGLVGILIGEFIHGVFSLVQKNQRKKAVLNLVRTGQIPASVYRLID